MLTSLSIQDNGTLATKNLTGVGMYFGPGMPSNTDWHHYTWTPVATDLDPEGAATGGVASGRSDPADPHRSRGARGVSSVVEESLGL